MLLPARIAAVVLGAFGLLAVVLAATGVYGIMAYAVARRTREIGIRMALGARRGSVLSVVLRRTAILVVVGTLAGVGLSLAAGRVFSQILYGISATDPLTYALAISMMAAVAGVGLLGPGHAGDVGGSSNRIKNGISLLACNFPLTRHRNAWHTTAVLECPV